MSIKTGELLTPKTWLAKAGRELRTLARENGFTSDALADAQGLLAHVKHTQYDDARLFASDLMGMAIGEENSTNAINALTSFRDKGK